MSDLKLALSFEKTFVFLTSFWFMNLLDSSWLKTTFLSFYQPGTDKPAPQPTPIPTLLICLIMCQHNPLEGGSWNNMETVQIRLCNNPTREALGPFQSDWQAGKGEKFDPKVICFQSCEMVSWNRREARRRTGTCKYTQPPLDYTWQTHVTHMWVS